VIRPDPPAPSQSELGYKNWSNRMKTDKMLHLLASYCITLTAMLFAGYLGVIVGAVAGVGKELWDYARYGRQMAWRAFLSDSRGDLIADASGIVIAMIIYLLRG